MSSPSSGAPKVAVVVPIHNGIHRTRRLLDSLQKSGYPALEIIVIDGGSTDGSADVLPAEFPDVEVVPGTGDMWWTRATNAGVTEALGRGAEYVLTINQDAVVAPEAVQTLVETANARPRALIGAQVCSLENPGQIWFAGARFDPVTADVAHETRKLGGITPTGMLTGLGMLIPRRAFQDVGLFDEGFPQYFADCDLSLRAKGAGYELLVQPRAVIYNEVASSWLVETVRSHHWSALGSMLFKPRSPYWVSGRIRFYRRHWGSGYRRALLKLYWRLATRFCKALLGKSPTFGVGGGR